MVGWVEKTPQLDLYAPLVVINKNEIMCFYLSLKRKKRRRRRKRRNMEIMCSGFG